MSETAVVSADTLGAVKHRRARRILTLVFAILLLLLGLAAYLLYNAVNVPRAVGGDTTDTGGVQWVRSIYGTSNRPQDLFAQTQAAFPGEDGTIWVTDVGHPSGITQFRPDGRYLRTLASRDASAPLSSPSRIAVGPDGRIYACETALDRIRVLEPDGSDGGSISVPQPVSVAVSEDRIAVGSVSGFAVLDMQGKPLGVFGTRGKGPDQFDYVHGIAFGPDGSIYVADSYNNRLSAYESNGKRRWMIRTGAPANSAELTNDLLTSKPTSDTVLKGSDALQLPLGLTVDGADRLVVADMYDCTMAVFEAKTGEFIGKYGDVGGDDGQFFYPVSVSYDSQRDWFTVADAFNRRVQIVRIPGSSAGVGIAAAVSRAMAGPLRACALPLLLLLLVAGSFVVARAVRRRRLMALAAETTDSAATDAAASQV